MAMQRRTTLQNGVAVAGLLDCYRQQRFPAQGYAFDATVTLDVYMGVNANGAEAIAPSIER